MHPHTRAHICNIFSTSLSLSLSLPHPLRGYRSNSLRYGIFFEYFHLPSLCSSAACLSVRTCLQMHMYVCVCWCVCVSTYRFFPLMCIYKYIYIMFIYYIACTGCCRGSGWLQDDCLYTFYAHIRIHTHAHMYIYIILVRSHCIYK